METTRVSLSRRQLGAATFGIASAICTLPVESRALGATERPVIRGVADPMWARATYSSADALRHPEEIASVGANWIAVGPALVMNSPTDSVIYRDSARTASDESLRAIVAAAHHAGLKVLMRPFVDCMTSGRTTIDPADRGTWFGWLRYWMNYYAVLSQQLDVEMMCIGANFERLSSDYKFLQVVNQVRDRFAGKVVYDATIYEYPQVVFWNQLDYIGIDAYWSLNPTSDLDAEAIQNEWDSIVRRLSSFSQEKGKQILFTEAGYRSIRGAVYNPVDWQTTGIESQEAQAAAYSALLAANSGQAYFAGVFWWQWDIVGKIDQSRDYTPHGKLAENVLRDFWAP